MMADWVKCKGPNDPNDSIYVNLDQVVSITPIPAGCHILYAGTEEAFAVANRASDILGSNVVRDA
jgi:hypothetical protein